MYKSVIRQDGGGHRYNVGSNRHLHASTCAKKLRQKSYAMSLMAFIHTNNFRKDSPQYWRNTVVHLPVPTNDTLEIVHYALAGLKTIFMQGYQYRTGVIITEITDSHQIGTV